MVHTAPKIVKTYHAPVKAVKYHPPVKGKTSNWTFGKPVVTASGGGGGHGNPIVGQGTIGFPIMTGSHPTSPIITPSIGVTAAGGGGMPPTILETHVGLGVTFPFN